MQLHITRQLLENYPEIYRQGAQNPDNKKPSCGNADLRPNVLLFVGVIGNLVDTPRYDTMAIWLYCHC